MIFSCSSIASIGIINYWYHYHYHNYPYNHQFYFHLVVVVVKVVLVVRTKVVEGKSIRVQLSEQITCQLRFLFVRNHYEASHK